MSKIIAYTVSPQGQSQADALDPGKQQDVPNKNINHPDVLYVHTKTKDINKNGFEIHPRN